MACGVRRDGARGAGFTLIEVIVSIGIVAILIGLLMPSLREVRVRAQRVALGSQMRMHVGAVSMYATDHADTYPVARANPIDNMLHWHLAMVAGEYIAGPADIDPVGVRTRGDPRVAISGALSASVESMSPGGVTIVDNARVSRVRQSDVVDPAQKGVLVQYVSEERSAHWFWTWNHAGRVLSPVVFLDGRVRDHRCTDFLIVPDYIEEWVGHPVLSTWYGVRGRDVTK